MGPSLLYADISALDEAGLRQTLPKRVSIEAIGIGRGAVQEAHKRRVLLRTRCEWQGSRAAQQRNEITSFHVCPLMAGITSYHMGALWCITANLGAD